MIFFRLSLLCGFVIMYVVSFFLAIVLTLFCIVLIKMPCKRLQAR